MQTTSTLVSVDVVIIAFTLFILNLSLVLINLTPVSEDPHSAVMADYTEFMNHKNIKTMANRRLARWIQKLLPNIRLSKKTDIIDQRNSSTLSTSRIVWASKCDQSVFSEFLKVITRSDEAAQLLVKCEELMNKLYNIFCHYLVNNSFDTHFIIDNIDRLNKACIESRAGAIQKLKELKQENDLNNESFNPFIEVNEKEESKFVDLNSQEHINKAAGKLSPI